MMPITEEFRHLMHNPRRIVLINHWNPDGDAVGSVFTLAQALQSHGHTVHIVMPNAYPDFLHFLESAVPVLIAEKQEKEATEVLRKADLLGTLDFNRADRAGDFLTAFIEQDPAKVFMLDHHREPSDYARYQLSFPEVASTCELVFELLEALEWTDSLNANAAQALYTGMITDTGSFRFPTVRPKTLSIAAQLLEKGAQPWVIHEQIFDQDRESRLRLLSKCLANMEVDHSLGAVVMWLEKADLQKWNFQKGDTEGFVNYGLSMKGIRVSAFVIEREEGWKLSLRSKGAIDVSAMARDHFDGGGHFNAAGGQSSEDLSSIKNTLWQLFQSL